MLDLPWYCEDIVRIFAKAKTTFVIVVKICRPVLAGIEPVDMFKCAEGVPHALVTLLLSYSIVIMLKENCTLVQ